MRETKRKTKEAIHYMPSQERQEGRHSSTTMPPLQNNYSHQSLNKIMQIRKLTPQDDGGLSCSAKIEQHDQDNVQAIVRSSPC